MSTLLLVTTVANAETRTLPVPVVTIYPGDPLSPSLVVDKSFAGSPAILSGYVHSTAQIAGKFARRTLVAGLPISLSAIREHEVVFQGTPVAAVLEATGLSIQTSVLPLENGAPGDIIRARNSEGGLTITATVMANGTLRVSPQ